MERSSSTERYQPVTSKNSGDVVEVLPDLAYLTDQIVNVIFVGNPEPGNPWVLVDAGMPKSGGKIIEKAEERFGKDRPPEAIVLTHGHFDHIGGIIDILEKWHVPVYAHPLEHPYLTGSENYPDPDVTVEGGMLAKLSFLFPTDPIVITEFLEGLPEDGTVPPLPGWRWIHTPGHSAGHVSFFRDADRALIAGDAFVTVRQDQLYKVMTQEKELTGPPRYLTPDWTAAESSVHTLNGLKPAYAVTGHGEAAEGAWLTEHLDTLDRHFKELAVPDHGKYVKDEEKGNGR
ncbi:MBL fold metallo-hydrolase [Sporosarcina sp. NCCP-2716]|uniref:MBL fold metallo-hydrolase n=1 Tax=Sporosarcina sp. NCCP-2716 TaxID=2943679 RepID=UPI00203CA1EA|nr:MBL fold metallo-hydrolase [Sporosarcina sp. NCCP-2716]GKV68204.1 MBL fold metallo-hydrolase [Sporosarcina sp. NCCP-2716]